ncbi:MAG: VOC family protein [Pseudomonadota bacterium]
MSTAYKPEGYTSLAPYLVVEGARQVIEFLVTVFDAERLRMIDAPDGRLMHGEVRIDDTVVMLGDPGAGAQRSPAHLHVYVADVDAVYRKALANGAEPVQAPVKKDDPDKRGGFKDPSGTTWWVATQMGEG